MSINEKMVTIAENEQKVFNAGKKAEYDRFWDICQDYGNRRHYTGAFGYQTWTDETFQPKYPIINDFEATQMFGYATLITKINVPIVQNAANGTYMFRNCSNLVTILSLDISNVTNTSNAFVQCRNLVDINFVGTINADISFQWSTNLSHDSLMSIINALGDFSGDTSGTTHTLTIGSGNVAKLTADELLIAENKGWDVV